MFLPMAPPEGIQNKDQSYRGSLRPFGIKSRANLHKQIRSKSPINRNDEGLLPTYVFQSMPDKENFVIAKNISIV